MKYYLLVAITIVFGTLYLFSSRPPVQQPIQRASSQTVELREFLRQMGDKYDRHFTLEVVPRSVGDTDSMETVSIREGENIASILANKSIKESLDWLREAVPNLVYLDAEGSNDRVIHIVDSRLNSRSDYALNKVIDNLKFDGLLSELPTAIARKGISVASKNFGDTREMAIVDYSTKVQIEEKNKRVRDILSGPVGATGRGRLLWIAETDLEKNAVTYVRYFIKI